MKVPESSFRVRIEGSDRDGETVTGLTHEEAAGTAWQIYLELQPVYKIYHAKPITDEEMHHGPASLKGYKMVRDALCGEVTLCSILIEPEAYVAEVQ